MTDKKIPFYDPCAKGEKDKKSHFLKGARGDLYAFLSFPIFLASLLRNFYSVAAGSRMWKAEKCPSLDSTRISPS